MSPRFHKLLLDHMPRMRAQAMTLTRNHSDADDLVQSVALQVLRSESQFDMQTSFPAWTYRIVRNAHISNCRRKNCRQTISIDEISENDDSWMALATPARQEEHVMVGEVTRAIEALAPKFKKVLSLICGSQLSHEEAGAALSCSVSAIKSRLFQARRKLEEQLLCPYDGLAALPRSLAATGRGRVGLAAAHIQ